MTKALSSTEQFIHLLNVIRLDDQKKDVIKITPIVRKNEKVKSF